MLPWAIRPGESDLRDHRYQGWLVGWGVSYGYHCAGQPLGLEATVGVGYAYLDYDKYPCAKCGRENRQRLRTLFRPHQKRASP